MRINWEVVKPLSVDRSGWSGCRYVPALVRFRLHEPECGPKKLASTSSEKAVIAVLAPVCADKFGALPDVAARNSDHRGRQGQFL